MGRGGYRGTGKRRIEVESCWVLTVWGQFQDLQHIGVFVADDLEAEWEWQEDYLELTTTRSADRWSNARGKPVVQRIALTHTACNFGKTRVWFVCPNCGRRAAKIYLPANVVRNDVPICEWACCQCWRITYNQRNARDKTLCYEWRAERIAERWLGEMTQDWIGKRKGQHQSTFNKRADQYEELLAHSNANALAAIASLLRRG